MARTVLHKEAAQLFAAALTVAGRAYAYLSQVTTLRVAVAPQGGTEPLFLMTFAEAPAKKKLNVRLTLVQFEDVEERTAAPQVGQADHVVVGLDVRMPNTCLTLAILREQAVLLLALENWGITTLMDPAGKRLGYLAAQLSGWAVIEHVVDWAALNPSAAHPDARC